MGKMLESINNDLEELKNKHTETNNTITEIKNTLGGINSGISEAEEWISELEDKMVEITSEKNWYSQRHLGQYQTYQQFEELYGSQKKRKRKGMRKFLKRL